MVVGKPKHWGIRFTAARADAGGSGRFLGNLRPAELGIATTPGSAAPGSQDMSHTYHRALCCCVVSVKSVARTVTGWRYRRANQGQSLVEPSAVFDTKAA